MAGESASMLVMEPTAEECIERGADQGQCIEIEDS